MATSSILSWILIFTCSSAVLAEPKGDGRKVLSGADATKEIEEFVTKRWLKQRWQIEWDERMGWHVRGTETSVLLEGVGVPDMKSFDAGKVYEFTGVPMDKRWNFIAFYVSSKLEPVETPGTERRAEQGGADRPTKPSDVTPQVPAPRDAATVLPLLRKFTPELGMEYIETVLGEPAGDIGSNFPLNVYPLNDGTTVWVLQHIDHDHGPASGNSSAVISIAHGTQMIYDSRK